LRVSLLKPPKEKQQPPSEPVLTGRELIEHHAFEARKQIVTALREFNYAEQLEFIALVRFQLDDLEKSRKAA
jgi:predicted transcriptional regulator